MRKLSIANSLIVLFFALTLCSNAALATVELPEEELAKESVLPKFENSVSVKNRNVTLTKKIEIAPYIGWNFTEAIFNQMKFGANLSYHLNEDHALSLNVAAWSSGLSQYGDQLQSPSVSSPVMQFSRAPRPQTSVYGNWEITAYYGKFSLTKSTVGNLTLYPIFGAGMTAYTHKSYFGLNGGVGLKVFFNKFLALRTDLKLQYAQQTEPFLFGKMRAGDPTPQYSEFSEKWMMNTIIDVGLAFLF